MILIAVTTWPSAISDTIIILAIFAFAALLITGRWPWEKEK